MGDVTRAAVVAAAQELAGIATRTPVEYSRALSALTGVPVWLKCENLQRTGSFKSRGAYIRLSRLPEATKRRGVVAASAGNHAQGVALAARSLGIKAVVFMPTDAALPKVAATRDYGAEVRLVGETVADAIVAAMAEAERTGAEFIHPYDHPDVVAGQGTIGLEILEQVPDVADIVVPLGGGGLLAGIAAALDGTAVRATGVQAARAAAYPDALAAGRPLTVPPRSTMADGIAVPTPGTVPFSVIKERCLGVVTVSEEYLSRAVLLVAERAKLVSEPAGSAGVAALLAEPSRWSNGPVVVVISGGNVDPLVLLRIIRHGMVADGRYLQMSVRLADRPGALADLVSQIAGSGGNVMHVTHLRTDVGLGIDEVEVNLQVETKGPAHCEALIDRLAQRGFTVSRAAQE